MTGLLAGLGLGFVAGVWLTAWYVKAELDKAAATNAALRKERDDLADKLLAYGPTVHLKGKK